MLVNVNTLTTSYAMDNPTTKCTIGSCRLILIVFPGRMHGTVLGFNISLVASPSVFELNFERSALENVLLQTFLSFL